MTVSIATLGLSFLISAAITGPISYMLTNKVLKKILNNMAADSIKMIDMLNNERKNSE